jgi:hypothetical protein
MASGGLEQPAPMVDRPAITISIMPAIARRRTGPDQNVVRRNPVHR